MRFEGGGGVLLGLYAGALGCWGLVHALEGGMGRGLRHGRLRSQSRGITGEKGHLSPETPNVAASGVQA